jgi:hypothetical protein
LFLICRPCGFNQRYCSKACAEVARAESVAAAQVKYRLRVRATPEGRARHRNEMRELRAARKIAVVGDQLSPAAPEPSTVVDMTGTSSSGAVVVRPIEQMRASAGLRSEQGVGWTLLVTPELLTEAQQLRAGKCAVSCACCGRAARIARIVIRPEPPWTAQWRIAVRRRHERMQP